MSRCVTSRRPNRGSRRAGKRRTGIVGVFADRGAAIRLVCAMLLEQKDGRAVQRSRYIMLQSVVQLGDEPIFRCRHGNITNPALLGITVTAPAKLHHAVRTIAVSTEDAARRQVVQIASISRLVSIRARRASDSSILTLDSPASSATSTFTSAAV